MTIPEGFGPTVSHPCDMSEQINELAAAMAKAQSEMTGAAKGTENTYFKSRYADLAACWDACRGPLTDNEISVFQTTEPAKDGVTVVTTIAHSSGQWMRGRLTMIPDKPGPQPLGSCITYARRYALAAMVGLAQVDDDAESATFRMSKQEETKITRALFAAADKDDGPGALEVWDELSNEKKTYIWGCMDRHHQKQLNALLKAAQDDRNNKTDPNYIDPLPANGIACDRQDERKQANG